MRFQSVFFVWAIRVNSTVWQGHLGGTGLPTKDGTETTVRNLYCLYSIIQDSMAHPTVNVFLSLSYHLKAMTRIHGRIFSLTQTKSYLKIFRSSLQSHPMFLTLQLLISLVTGQNTVCSIHIGTSIYQYRQVLFTPDY